MPVGTNIGGGTFWGLCKLLTGMDSFNDILALSDEGDNSNVRAVTSSGRQRQGGQQRRRMLQRRRSWWLCWQLRWRENVLHLNSPVPSPNHPLLLQVDMLVGDIYGGRDYTGIGLSGEGRRGGWR